MRKRARELTWEIRRLTATPAALVGFVNAPYEKSALEIAIKDKNLKNRLEDQKRPIAVRHR
jgi:hypothetical protein